MIVNRDVRATNSDQLANARARSLKSVRSDDSTHFFLLLPSSSNRVTHDCILTDTMDARVSISGVMSAMVAEGLSYEQHEKDTASGAHAAPDIQQQTTNIRRGLAESAKANARTRNIYQTTIDFSK